MADIFVQPEQPSGQPPQPPVQPMQRPMQPNPAARPVVKSIFRGQTEVQPFVEPPLSAANITNPSYNEPLPEVPGAPDPIAANSTNPANPEPPPETPAAASSTNPANPSPNDQNDFADYDNYDEYDDAFPELFPGMPRPIAEELLYEWQAPSRPYKQRDKQFFTTTGMIAVLMSLILFFAGQLIAIAVVIALVFLIYVFATIPPQTVTNKITTYGLRVEKELYYWDELGWFWFKKKYDDELVNIEVSRFPNRLTLLIGKADKELIRLIFAEVLLENEPPPTYYEQASAWLQEKIPLDV